MFKKVSYFFSESPPSKQKTDDFLNAELQAICTASHLGTILEDAMRENCTEDWEKSVTF